MKIEELLIDGERPFFYSLKNNLADDEFRGIYADWLEEHNQQMRSDYLRLQIILRTVGLSEAQRNECLETLSLLKDELPTVWVCAIDHNQTDAFRRWLSEVCDQGVALCFSLLGSNAGTQGWGQVCENFLLFFENGPFGGEVVIPLETIDENSVYWWSSAEGNWMARPALPER